MCAACGTTYEPDARLLGGFHGRVVIAGRAESLLAGARVRCLPAGWIVTGMTGRTEVALTFGDLCAVVARHLGVDISQSRRDLLSDPPLD